MISFGNADSSHSGLIPLKTVYVKRGELLWAIARKKNFIDLHSAAFVKVLHLIWFMPTNFAFKKNRSIIFFINWTIPRSIVNKYTLQVLRTLKTRRAFKQDLKYDQFVPQILCLQVSVLVIHWHCFQVSNARAHLAKRNKFASKRIPDYFRKKYLEYANNWLLSQIAVRAETVNVTAHFVGWNT